MNPDVVSSGVALASTIAAMGSIARREPGTVRASMQALLTGIALLLFCRLWAWSGDRWADIPLMVVASVLPLLVVLATEQMARRHASKWLKLTSAGAAASSLIVVPLLGWAWPVGALIALAGVQSSVGLGACIMLFNVRDVSDRDRTACRTFATALMIAIPFALTDFADLFVTPVRLGSVGVSLLLLAIALIGRSEATPSALWRDIVLCLVSGMLASLLAWMSMSPSGLYEFGMICSCGTAGMLIVRTASAPGRRDGSLVSALASNHPKGIDALLGSHPLLSGGQLLEPEDLEIYDRKSLLAIGAAGSVTRGTDLGDAGAVARDLLDRAASTHLVHLGGGRFLAVSAGGMVGGSLDDELRIVSGMAECMQ